MRELKRGRMKRDSESDEEKRRTRQMRLGTENQVDKGRIEIPQTIQYHVMSQKKRGQCIRNEEHVTMKKRGIKAKAN